MPGKIEMRVQVLMQETGTTPMDLVRFGLSPTTAYKLREGRMKAISFEVLATVCAFFAHVGRPVDPGDILFYTQGGEAEE